MKMTSFWVMSPCNLLEVGYHFRAVYFFFHHGPDDGDHTHFWNIGLLLCDYVAPFPRRLLS
jgi:hypothetical protein